MNIIDMQDFTFAYDEKKNALNKLNTSIERNKITGIIGGNGAGKSTFLLALNGINKAKSGQLLFKNKQVNYDKKSLIELRKSIGVVFQNPDDQLFLDDAVKDISFGMKNIGLKDDVILKEVAIVVEQLHLEDFIENPIHTMSFGQKKKIALAGILVMKPEVIILDEPTAGLDPEGITDLFNLIFKLKEEFSLTILISTHDLDLVALYCDNVKLINKGNIVYDGLTKNLLKQPQLLRDNHLRLPRIAHLMEILADIDGLPVDKEAATISQARLTLNKLYKESLDE